MALYEMRIYNVKVCVIENVHAGSEAPVLLVSVYSADASVRVTGPSYR